MADSSTDAVSMAGMVTEPGAGGGPVGGRAGGASRAPRRAERARSTLGGMSKSSLALSPMIGAEPTPRQANLAPSCSYSASTALPAWVAVRAPTRRRTPFGAR